MPRSDDNVTAIELVDPLVGTIFDKRFHVDERIAAGGFGAIYRATHVKSGHQIALKVLHPTLASDLGVLARFRREGTTLTSLRNPHTITAYEYGQADKTLFIVLELLTGETLYDRYESHGPFDWKRVVHIAKQVCESLEEAHAQGIVHRDLKPTNIHLEEQGHDPDYVKVLDFGIAKIVRGSDHDSSDITNAGQMIGTLDYMSPEQMVGGQVTGQSDIYTLGIVMYELIAGTRPFPESTTAGAALAAMLKTTPEPLHLRAPVPHELDAIVMRCLARETQRRFRTVGELRAELELLVRDPIRGSTTTLTMSRRDDDDATTVTPPPEKVLEALKTPRVERETPALDLQTPDVELMTKTPRVEARRNPASQWAEDDESTAARLPSGYEATLPAVTTFPPARPDPRPFESRHIPTPVPQQVVVAPFSTPRPRSLTGQLDPLQGATTLGLPPAPARTPTPGAFPVVPATPVPGYIPPMPPASMRPQSMGFDMSELAARDAAIRRLVWILALVLAAGVGVVIAARM